MLSSELQVSNGIDFLIIKNKRFPPEAFNRTLNISVWSRVGSSVRASQLCDAEKIGLGRFPRDILQTELTVHAAYTRLTSGAASAQTPPTGILKKRKGRKKIELVKKS